MIVLTSRNVFHTAGTNAPFAVAPIEEPVSGCPITPPELDESEGQSSATKVSQPRFSQSVCVGLCDGWTSTGTCHAFGAKAAFDFFLATGAPRAARTEGRFPAR